MQLLWMVVIRSGLAPWYNSWPILNRKGVSSSYGEPMKMVVKASYNIRLIAVQAPRVTKLDEAQLPLLAKPCTACS
jgi:hypothetical protein